MITRQPTHLTLCNRFGESIPSVLVRLPNLELVHLPQVPLLKRGKALLQNLNYRYHDDQGEEDLSSTDDEGAEEDGRFDEKTIVTTAFVMRCG